VSATAKRAAAERAMAAVSPESLMSRLNSSNE
jgi:hypothetical protein